MVDLFVCVCFSCVFILFLLTVYAYVLMCSLSPVYLAGRCTVACIKKKKKSMKESKSQNISTKLTQDRFELCLDLSMKDR